MINYENIVADNLFTEGFEASLPSPMSLLITAGMVAKVNNRIDVRSDAQIGVDVVNNFQEIEIDLEADPEIPVIYDVYLLAENDADGFNIHVARTELGIETIAIYEGTAPLLHCLVSIQVPPGTTDLAGIPVNIRNVKLKEATTDEIPT